MSERLSDKTADQHFMLADLFFERVRQIGFVTFDEIKVEFVQRDFPRWWQTHVMMDSRDEKTVRASLKKLFKFIEAEFGLDISRFGF